MLLDGICSWYGGGWNAVVGICPSEAHCCIIVKYSGDVKAGDVSESELKALDC